jgi:cytoskeletal protein RodZ
MNKTNQSHSKLIRLTTSVIILAIALSAFLLLTQNHKLINKKSNASSRTYSTKPAPAADNKQSQAVKTGISTSPGSPKQSTQSSTSNTTKPTFSVQIVSSVVNNNNLHIGTLVSGTTVGACTLTASQQNQPTITLGTSNVRLDVNNYDCGVFNINTSKFSNSGVWKITLSVNYNGQTATNSVNVTI